MLRFGCRRLITTKYTLGLKTSPKPVSKNNTITAERAYDEFGITSKDLKHLKSELIRSPYHDDEFIKVYLEEEIQALTGRSASNTTQNDHQNEVENWRKRRNLAMRSKHVRDHSARGSEQTVMWSFRGNLALFFVKSVAAVNCGSASMVSEAVHSLTDTLNQAVLLYGMRESKRAPNVQHPYGYKSMKHITALISGVGIFCLGAGVSIWHGLSTLYQPHMLHEAELIWAYSVLGVSFFLESIVLSKAILTACEGASKNEMTLIQYIRSGRDPQNNVVMLEDTVAVGGCVVAAACMALTTITQNPMFDASGSIIIGLGLAKVAYFLVSSNMTYLVGQSIPHETIYEIQNELEDRDTVRAVYDVKATYLGPGTARLKAEVHFDGKALADNYLADYSRRMLTNEFGLIAQAETDRERNEIGHKILKKHMEGAIDDMGKEIDDIEKELKSKYPEIKHVDLEVH